MEELKQAVRKLKNDKSLGQGKITSEMLKNMRMNGTNILLEIVNLPWKEETIPKDCELGIVF